MAVVINTATLSGIEGKMVYVEVDIARGLPCFNIVGMPDISVRESKERVRSAIINSGFKFPVCRITVNLAPADLRKGGGLFDLPISVGILLATGQINFSAAKNFMFLGELSLSGEIKTVKGALPIILEGCRNEIFKFVVPFQNADECSIIDEAEIYCFSTLSNMVNCINSNKWHIYKHMSQTQKHDDFNDLDYSDVIGQESSIRAIEIAAAGSHNIIMTGPPGVGKTMIAERIPTILPDMNFVESLEVTKIYSVSGTLDENKALIMERPFRNPHHTCSKIALIGGGNNFQPGEISLAHNGVLFLDEIIEFRKQVLEVLRQPLENRCIKISRARGTVIYPANFMLVGALNPCPCGNYGSDRACNCTESQRKKYIGKLSGPLIDRIDMFTFVRKISYKDIRNKKKSQSSNEIKRIVESARNLQIQRFKDENITCNSQMNIKLIYKYCKLNDNCKDLMGKIFDKYHLSTRAYTKILKVARTIADLNETSDIEEKDLIEAIQYRKFINEEIL